MEKMFYATGGYMRLDSWVMANLIQLGTQSFCQRFVTRQHDPCGRQYDQMTQAARSCVANIAEGTSRHQTSRETELKLLDVARASLAELAGDYVNFLLFSEKVPWEKNSPSMRQMYEVRLDVASYTSSDWIHESSNHILQQEKKFDIWLKSDDAEVVANVLLMMISRVISMLNHQLEITIRDFKDNGGFREQLTQIRQAAQASGSQSPSCPECGGPMRRRVATRGIYEGKEFWSCSSFPKCRGFRPI